MKHPAFSKISIKVSPSAANGTVCNQSQVVSCPLLATFKSELHDHLMEMERKSGGD